MLKWELCPSLLFRVVCSCSRMLNSSLKSTTEFEFYYILVLPLEQSVLFVNNYHCLLWLERYRRVCCALSSVTANQRTAAWKINYSRWKGASDTAHFIMWIKEHYPNIKQIGINIFIACEADQGFTSLWCRIFQISALWWLTSTDFKSSDMLTSFFSTINTSGLPLLY